MCAAMEMGPRVGGEEAVSLPKLCGFRRGKHWSLRPFRVVG